MYPLKEPQALQPREDYWGEHKIGAAERMGAGVGGGWRVEGTPEATKNAGHCGLQ